MFQAYDLAGGQVLTAAWTDLNLDTVLFNSDDAGEVFSLAGGELEILKTGDSALDVKVTVFTNDPGDW